LDQMFMQRWGLINHNPRSASGLEDISIHTDEL
jgi:hypothetical protein